MAALRIIHQITALDQSVKDVLKLAVILSRQVNGFLQLFIVLDLFAMHGETFQDLCTESEVLHWIHFEAVMLELILENPRIGDSFTALQNKFSSRR
jgi:hypothetical protein